MQGSLGLEPLELHEFQAQGVKTRVVDDDGTLNPRKDTVMLVLTRKTHEQLIIGGSIVVTVTQIDGNRVSLGIEAPPSVRILRAEVAAKEAEDEQRAA